MKIRSFTISLIVLIVFSADLISCGTLPVSPILTPSSTQTPTLVIPTETPTETPEPLLPPEVQTKFDQAGIDINKMANAELDKDGLHITLESRQVIITREQLTKNAYLGQPVEYNGLNQVFQIRDDANENVLFAYDTNTGEFLDASQYIQKDNSDPEKFIQVADENGLSDILSKEKMFLTPFNTESTYFPSADQIFYDYDNEANEQTWESDGEFNYYTPFGKLPNGKDSPFRIVNYIKMQRNTSIIGSTDTYIISEQIFNRDDGSFSTIHFMRGTAKVTLAVIQEAVIDGNYLLPRLKLSDVSLANPTYKTLKDYLEDKKLLDRNGSMPVITDLVFEWFETGHVPKELEGIYCAFTKRFIR